MPDLKTFAEHLVNELCAYHGKFVFPKPGLARQRMVALVVSELERAVYIKNLESKEFSFIAKKLAEGVTRVEWNSGRFGFEREDEDAADQVAKLIDSGIAAYKKLTAKRKKKSAKKARRGKR